MLLRSFSSSPPRAMLPACRRSSRFTIPMCATLAESQQKCRICAAVQQRMVEDIAAPNPFVGLTLRNLPHLSMLAGWEPKARL